LAISPIMHVKKPRRSPLRLRFLTYILEEISCAIYITYFPTIPKVCLNAAIFYHRHARDASQFFTGSYDLCVYCYCLQAGMRWTAHSVKKRTA